VHDSGETVTKPVPLTWSQLTVPVGEAPVTVAVHVVELPRSTVSELHVTAVPGATRVTVTTIMPPLTRSLVSPLYSAETVTLPGVAPVTVMVQEPDVERVHAAGLGNVTLPVPD
jgi:hypothetical protein